MGLLSWIFGGNKKRKNRPLTKAEARRKAFEDEETDWDNYDRYHDDWDEWGDDGYNDNPYDSDDEDDYYTKGQGSNEHLGHYYTTGQGSQNSESNADSDDNNADSQRQYSTYGNASNSDYDQDTSASNQQTVLDDNQEDQSEERQPTQASSESYGDDQDEENSYNPDEENTENEDENREEEDSDEAYDRYEENKVAPNTVLGQPSILNVIGPMYWSTDDVMREYFIMRENMKHRTYGMPVYIPQSGYPHIVSSRMFESTLALGYVDITIDVVPRERRNMVRDLTNRLHIIRSNAEFQSERNQSFQMRENVTKMNSINNILNQIQFDENRMYDVNISMIIYGNSDRELREHLGTVEDQLSEYQTSITPYVERCKSGYLETIPMGARMYNIDDTFRNFDRKALGVIGTATTASGRFNGGIPFAVNEATPSQNTEYLNVFGTETHRPDNYNMGFVGESGSGKSTANKLKIANEVSILGIEHRSIDPDGEYILLAKSLNQLNLTITSSQDTPFRINPCALSLTETPLEDVTETDSNGNQLSEDEVADNITYGDDGRKVVTHEDGQRFVQSVDISEMIENVKSFVNVILTSDGTEKGMKKSEEAVLEDALMKIVKRLKITNDPDSLKTDKSGIVGNKWIPQLPKKEPTLSDVYNQLVKDNTKNGYVSPKADRLLDALKPYLRTGSRPLFDGQTYFGRGRSADLNEYKYVNFDLSQLRGSLKKVAYYVISQYILERWLRNPSKAMAKKVVDADEILQFIDDPLMSTFFEDMARGCRKYNGSLCWITQDIKRLKTNPKADALVGDSEFFFVLKTTPEHRDLMKKALDLTDGELDILCSDPEPGEGILREEGNSIWVRTDPDDYQMKFAESNRAVQKAREEREEVDQLNQNLTQ